jgi:hypothetical protein
LIELRGFRSAAIVAVMMAWGIAFVEGCAESVTPEDDDASSTTTSASTGGSGGARGMVLPCGIDCSTITTPDCRVATCNVDTGQCQV